MLADWQELAAVVVLIAAVGAALSFLCGLAWKIYKTVDRIWSAVERSEEDADPTPNQGESP